MKNSVCYGLIVIAALFSAVAVIAQDIDEVVLIVNDQAITANEFTSLARLQGLNGVSGSTRPQLDDPVTEAIVNDALLLSHIGQIAPTQQVTPQQLQSAVSSLASQNRLSPAKLIENLRKDGIDVDVFQASLRNRLLIQNVVSQPLSSRISVSDTEVREYINNKPELKAQIQSEYELHHMAVAVKDNDDKLERAAALAVAKQARVSLLQGASFEEVISQSELISSSAKDGYLGWKTTSELPELFVWALDSLEENEISPVLESANGLHILKLSKKRGDNLSVAEYSIRHILKRVESGQDPSAAVSDINRIRTQILASGDFAEIARQESDDKGSAVNGGALGWVRLETLVPGFANAVTQLPLNTISQAVQSRFGVHLIEVLQKRTSQLKESPVEAKARQLIFAEKINAELDDLLNDLRSVAVVELVN